MTSKCKALMIAALLIVLLPMNAFSADTWLSGETHFYWRVGLTGGGTALDGISGASMCVNDGSAAISGNSIYFYTVSASGDASGTTTESSPDWIMPNTAAAGGALSGVSMWKLLSVNGVTGVFKALVIDNRTFSGTDIDQVKVALGISSFAMAALTAHTGASVISGTSMTANQNAASIGAAFLNSGTGDSAFVVCPYNLVVTGASLFVNVTGACGVSITVGASVGEIPSGGTTAYRLIDISNNATRNGNASGTTRIPAGYYIGFELKSAASGGSTWSVQVIGRKE